MYIYDTLEDLQDKKGDLKGLIHTSCSAPLFEGLKFGPNTNANNNNGCGTFANATIELCDCPIGPCNFKVIGGCVQGVSGAECTGIFSSGEETCIPEPPLITDIPTQSPIKVRFLSRSSCNMHPFPNMNIVRLTCTFLSVLFLSEPDGISQPEP